MANEKVDRGGLESAGFYGFATIEQRRAKKGLMNLNPNKKYDATTTIINSKEAAERYGGLVITSEKTAKRYGGIMIGPPITSDKAVQRYGGVLISDRPSDRAPRRS